MRISDLIAVDAESQIELIRHLSAMDMVERISWDGAPAEDPLRWALVNPRARRAARESDVLWVRVLDVQKALENRAWSADGDFTLEVADALGIASGRWRVIVRGGSAQVAAVAGTRTAGLCCALMLRPWAPCTWAMSVCAPCTVLDAPKRPLRTWT
ncbi:sterol carrier protein domain-containing protein [Nesterenkonia pannonica]|uniref:sterol carrier protein domain-containing protein n=1 Tax=Nesterenkonia pannonica TaxID=1548602 RepID=UPI002164654F|nr:sterol carrier protein domain-containing protein [Nesterenkonia pannonica]